MFKEQKLRAVLYYMSVAIFFTGLPFILTFTLGYKFDSATWKFTRTGLISFKTQPPGASVWLNGALVNDKTPCSVNELLPAVYTVELRLPGHYPYSTTVEVRESAVARLEKVLLFPLRPDVQKLNKEPIAWFWIDEDKMIYYIGADSNDIYKSDLEGDRFEKIAEFVPLDGPIKEWKLSPDRKRILYYSARRIGIVELESGSPSVSFALDPGGSRAVREIFWYSDSYNIIVINGTDICMLEARPDSRPFILMKLDSAKGRVFYESDKETLYFQDSQSGADNKSYDNVFKLELGRKLYPFRDFIRMKNNE